MWWEVLAKVKVVARFPSGQVKRTEHIEFEWVSRGTECYVENEKGEMWCAVNCRDIERMGYDLYKKSDTKPTELPSPRRVDKT